MKGKIIAFSGKIGSGKDTAASFMKELLPNFEYKRFADIPKENTAQILGVDKTIFNSHDHPKKNFYRKYYRDYAEKCKDVFGDDVWGQALKNQYKNGDKWLILDLRFPYEIEAIESLDADVVLIRMLRTTEKDNQHISEIALDEFDKWNYVIDNREMSLDELKSEIHKIIRDIEKNVGLIL